MRAITCLSLSLVLVACAGGSAKQGASEPAVAKRGDLDQSLFSKDPNGILSEDAIQAILARPLEIDLPARVGILPITPARDWHGPGPAHDQPSPAVAELARELRGSEPFTMVTEMMSIPSGALGMEALREIAARYKLRYVVLYRENLRRERRTNAWTIGYVTLVGALFLPGDTLEIDGYVEASMFDVKTGLLMFTVRKRVRKQQSENPWHTDDKLDDIQQRLAVATATELAAELRGGIDSFENAVAAERVKQEEKAAPPAARPGPTEEGEPTAEAPETGEVTQ